MNLDLFFAEVRFSLVERDCKQKSYFSWDLLVENPLAFSRDLRDFIELCLFDEFSWLKELSFFCSVFRLKVWILSNEVWSSSPSLRWNLRLELQEDCLEGKNFFFDLSELALLNWVLIGVI